MAQSDMLKVFGMIAKYAAMGEAAVSGIQALISVLDQFNSTEVTAADIDREIAAIDKRVNDANERDAKRFSGRV